MPTRVREFLDYIAAEGRVIRDAPAAFSVFVVLSALVIWVALSWKFDAQISSRDSIISARDATIKFHEGLIAEYKSRVQLPEPGEERKLTPDQRRIIAHELKLRVNMFKRLVVVYIEEKEPRQYAKQFADIATNSDLQIVQRGLSSTLTGDVGIYVLVPNTTKPSDDAKEFMEILNKAYLSAHYYERTILREYRKKTIPHLLCT